MNSSSIRLLYGSHVIQSDTGLTPLTKHKIFIVVDEGNHQQFGHVFYGVRIGLWGACPWAFPATHVRLLDKQELTAQKFMVTT